MPDSAQPPAGPVLVRTKLHPALPRGGVARPHLVGTLAASRARLALVRAPAGAGKTSLLAEWAASEQEPRSFAWLALDPGDNDPRRFWTYAVEALATVEPRVGDTARDLLAVAGAGIEDTVIPALINDLVALPDPIVLVLDDYHAIRDAQVHDTVAFLLGRLPPTLELAIASRTEPPLPLARLRARGELAEVDARGLRFTRDEAAALLDGVLGLGLEDEDVDRLWERTEGWAAGLYLAALSLRGRESARDFVADFAGDDRHVMDYLGEEVLAELPGDTRDFLLRTSVLERLSPPLCDAVLQRDDSAARLAEIERSNLLLVPLDERREWYRYHHLFADLLRVELERRLPGERAELHRRAAAWFAAAGLADEAIRHRLAARDIDEAAELVAMHWSPYLQHGEATTALRWLEALPEDRLRADARLSLARAVAEMATGHPERAPDWIEAARGAPALGPFHDGTTSVESGLAGRQCMFAMNTGDFTAAQAAAERTAQLESEDSPWLGVALAVQGICRCWHGDYEAARPLLEAGIEHTRRVGMQNFPIIYSLGHMAVMAGDEGDWEQAARQARDAIAVAEESGTREHWTVCLAHAVLARAPGSDSAEAARAIELARRGAGPLPLAYSLLALGDEHALEEARAVVAAAPEAGTMSRMLAEAGGPAPVAAAANGSELSERELAVLRLLPTDLSQREIGRELYVSLNTVKSHTRSIFRKLGASNREEAVERAREQGLI